VLRYVSCEKMVRTSVVLEMLAGLEGGPNDDDEVVAKGIIAG